MTEFNDDLGIEFHRRIFAVYQPDSHPDERVYFENQALEGQALTVSDALIEEFYKTSSILPQSLKSEQARIYLAHGVGRRLNTMLYSFQSITHIAHVGRSQPLSHEEQQVLSRDLNLVYMNVRGVLDNLAACLNHETQPELVLGRMKTDLFSPVFRKELRAYEALAPVISKHDAWNTEVKSRRDPVAHRIPLYLPPAILTPAEGERYRELNSIQIEKTLQGKREEAEEAKAKSERLGKFYPYFLHHPGEPAFPLYPTIPTDIGNVVRILRAVSTALVGCA